MKKIYSLLLLLPLLLGGCDEEKELRWELETPADTMLLSASIGEVMLQEDKADDVALEFTWKDATDRGEGTKLTYYFKLDRADNLFQTSIEKIEIPAGVYTKSFTHKELNELILKHWKVTAGETLELEAEIIASVSSSVYLKPEVSIARVIVTSYALKPKFMYMLGTATTAGNDPTKAILLKENVSGSIYSWKGNLMKGTFKFIEDQENLLPSYNKGSDEHTLVYRTSADEPDDMFTVEQSGMHSIYVDKDAMTIAYSYIPYEKVWMIGDATPAGWNIDSPFEMTWSAETPEVFTYEGILNAGEMKMPLSTGNWSCDYLMPVVDGAGISDNRVQLVRAGKVDYKWKITESGNYKISINVIKMTIKFEKK